METSCFWGICHENIVFSTIDTLQAMPSFSATMLAHSKRACLSNMGTGALEKACVGGILGYIVRHGPYMTRECSITTLYRVCKKKNRRQTAGPHVACVAWTGQAVWGKPPSTTLLEGFGGGKLETPWKWGENPWNTHSNPCFSPKHCVFRKHRALEPVANLRRSRGIPWERYGFWGPPPTDKCQ